jgi:uncharacterized membrane protein
VDIHNLLTFVLLTFFPGLELRASIPYGILVLGMDWATALGLAVFFNFVFGLALFLALDRLVRLFTRVQYIKEIYNRLVERTQKRAKPYVDKYGAIGIGLFIAIPLPGSGVWTGALAAYLLGMRFRKFALADAIGVVIAGLVVTLISLGLLNGLG